MKKRLLRNSWLRFTAVALLVGTFATGITGCDNGVRVKSAVYGSSISHPYDYYYYPYSRVYFSISSGYYYYPDGNNWIRVRTLPPRYYIDPRYRVTLKIKSNDRPYLWHREHRERYAVRPKYRVDTKRDRAERTRNFDRHRNIRRR